MAVKRLLIFSLFLCLICTNISTSSSKSEEDEERISVEEHRKHRYPTDHQYYDDSEVAMEGNETHVVVLKQSNFSEFIVKNRFVMVEFCAPWSYHCEELAPGYAAAATELKDEAVALAKVDATEEAELVQKFDLQGFPTIFFFVNGVHKPYPGERNKDAIVAWLKRKIGSDLHNITTTGDAERLFAKEESLVGSDSEELSAASHIEDDVSLDQTNSADVARLFHVDPTVNRLSVVIVKKEPEDVNYFDITGRLTATTDFLFRNEPPLVINVTRGTKVVFENLMKPLPETHSLTYKRFSPNIQFLFRALRLTPFPEESPHKQLILITTPRDTEKAYAIFQEVAKAFKGKLLFVHVELDKTSSDNHFAPTVLAYKGKVDNPTLIMNADFTKNNIKSFAEKFLADKHKLRLFAMYDDIKEVFVDNFDEIVLDESKDVLLQIYHPWCHRCPNLNPIYSDLAMNLRGINSVVIARMDVTFGQHPRAKCNHFPTILFFPAGQKSSDPITFKDDDPTSANLYTFVKEHASIPFELQRDVKDEL